MSQAVEAAEILTKRTNVADADLWDTEAYWPIFERMRREDPVHYCEDSDYGPYWSVTTYDHIMQVDMNHQVYSSETGLGGIIINDDIAVNQGDHVLQSFITMDPPRHEEQRKAVNGIVAPPNLEHFGKVIRERTARTLDSLPVNEEFDWVSTVSIELTTQMLATLFDFPFEDRHKLTRWSDVTTAEPSSGIIDSQEQRIEELMECLEYFKGLWSERENKEGGFDLVSMLSQNPATKNMDPMNFLGNLLLLIVGGNDTTRNSMSGGVYAFSNFPDEWTKLKNNPTLIDNMNSEIIRWQTPLAHMRRTAVADSELAGKQIKSGDKVVMWYASGNRDEAVFSEPNELRIDRDNARKHLSFGFGIHRCMGLRLAELQLRILWEEILKRWERIDVVGEPQRIKSNFIKGYATLPVCIKG